MDPRLRLKLRKITQMATRFHMNLRCGHVATASSRRSVVVRTAPVVPPVLSKETLYGNLGVAYDDLKRAPSSEVSEWSVMGDEVCIVLSVLYR